ncbi:MAG: GntR family transcriptional regulator [bacterium]
MSIHWSDDQPIYRQLKDLVVNMILDGSIGEGEALPSVRKVAADYQLNPITVSKAYQELVESNVVEKKRGLGMFIRDGAKNNLQTSERQHFLEQEWPKLSEKITRLGLTLEDLLK